MTFLIKCGLCCGLLSVWAIIQLTAMGFFYNMESFLLIEDVHAKEYNSYDDFIEKTKNNYQIVAVNCWIAAGMYGLMLVLSYFCYIKGKAKERKAELKYADENIFCDRPLPEKKEKKKPKPKKVVVKKEKKKGDDSGSEISL